MLSGLPLLMLFSRNSSLTAQIYTFNKTGECSKIGHSSWQLIIAVRCSIVSACGKVEGRFGGTAQLLLASTKLGDWAVGARSLQKPFNSRNRRTPNSLVKIGEMKCLGFIAIKVCQIKINGIAINTFAHNVCAFYRIRIAQSGCFFSLRVPEPSQR